MFIHQSEDYIDRRTMGGWRWKRKFLEYDLPEDQFMHTRHLTQSILFDGLIIPLQGRNVPTLSATYGDELKLYENGTWVNWLTDKTQGINKDFWVMSENGNLHVKRRWAMSVLDRIRIIYRHGLAADTTVNGTNSSSATSIRVGSTKYFQYSGQAYVANTNGTVECIYYYGVNGTTLQNVDRAQHGTSAVTLANNNRAWQIPGDINRACVLLTAVAVAHNDMLSMNEATGTGTLFEDYNQRITEWKNEAEEILKMNTEWVRVT
jgi:hypothetical protein